MLTTAANNSRSETQRKGWAAEGRVLFLRPRDQQPRLDARRAEELGRCLWSADFGIDSAASMLADYRSFTADTAQVRVELEHLRRHLHRQIDVALDSALSRLCAP
jgi:hypothetical protein